MNMYYQPRKRSIMVSTTQKSKDKKTTAGLKSTKVAAVKKETVKTTAKPVTYVQPKTSSHHFKLPAKLGVIFTLVLVVVIATIGMGIKNRLHQKASLNNGSSPKIVNDQMTINSPQQGIIEFDRVQFVKSDDKNKENNSDNTNETVEYRPDIDIASYTANGVDRNIERNDNTQLEMLQQQVDYLKKELENTQINQQANLMIFSLYDLQKRVSSGQNFTQEITILKRLLAGSQNIERKLTKFSVFAETGIMSDAMISETFNDTIARQIKLLKTKDASNSLKANANQLFTIRRIKETPEYLNANLDKNSIDSVLINVDSLLKARRYDRAIQILETELRKTDKPVPTDLRKWLDEVSIRAEIDSFVENAINNLQKNMRMRNN